MEGSDYQRGVTWGQLDQRLSNHDKQFQRINGSIDKISENFNGVAAELTTIRLAVQRLADGAVNRDATVITTASALKDAEDARRNTSEQQRQSSEQRWTPTSRVITVMMALVAIVSLVALFMQKG